MRVLDAHVHLWDLAMRPQPWTEQFPVLQRSFLLPELAQVLAGHGVDAAVVVQAGDTLEETLELLALAAATPASATPLAGVVGWADLAAPDVRAALAALRAAPGGNALVGVRQQLQLHPDPDYLARPAVRAGLAAVGAAGLVYDLVISPHQLPLATATAAAVPGTRFVLDHAGKPPIASRDIGSWKEDLAALAAQPNVAVKLSGLVTEADWAGWTQDDLAPVIDHVLACFGAARTMAGSDWPVCLLAAGYGDVQATLGQQLARRSDAGHAAIVGGTAAAWYQIGPR